MPENTATPVLSAKLPRGSKTTRVKTARLEAGHLLLTTPAGDPPQDRTVQPQQSKTGATVREVASLEPYYGGRTHGRSNQRQYRVHFTDGTRAESLAPIYTWHAVVTPGTLAEIASKA